MYKETIKFEDIEGNEVERDFYFRLTKMELVELLAGYEVMGGYMSFLAETARKNQIGPLIDLIHMVITKSYGVPSENKLSLIKNQELVQEFVGSDAYDKFVLGMLNDPDKFSKFFVAIAPKDSREDLEKALKQDTPENTQEAYKAIVEMKKEIEDAEQNKDEK